MARTRTFTVTAGVTPGVLWAALRDDRRRPEWTASLDAVTSRGADERLLHFVEGRREVEVAERDEVAEPANRLVRIVESSGMRQRLDLRLEPDGDSGTTLRAAMDVSGMTLLVRAFLPLVRGGIVTRQRSDLERLVDQLEGEVDG